MKAIVMNGTGGREMLEYVERPDPVAGPGQALVEIAVAGVNFMDIGVRQGTVWNEIPNPKILGVEGVGRVVAAGDGVEGLAPGQRVAWVYAPGSYAGRVAIPATSLVPVPEAEGSSVPADVLQDVVIQLAKVAQLSPRSHSFPPESQQPDDPAERRAGLGVPRTAASRPSRCSTHRAECRLRWHVEPFSVAFEPRQRWVVRLLGFHAEICSIFARNRCEAMVLVDAIQGPAKLTGVRVPAIALPENASVCWSGRMPC